MTEGHSIYMRGFQRWADYVAERAREAAQIRRPPPRVKPLFEFVMEAIDEALAADRALRAGVSGGEE